MTAQKRQVYVCGVCGIVAEILEDGAGELICCGQPMVLQQPGQHGGDPAAHTPVLQENADGCIVTIGSEPHPMDTRHHIQWVDILTGDGLLLRRQVGPGDAPEAVFPVPAVEARSFCTLHGLWADNAP